MQACEFRGCRLHHAAPPAGVHINHPHAEVGRSTHRRSHRVGYIVKLEIQEHIVALILQAPHQTGPAAREQFLAYLEPTELRRQLLDQGQRRGFIGIVESHQNGRVHQEGLQ